MGAHSKGAMSTEDLTTLESCACPGEGSCAGLFTANTMAAAIEAIGMSLTWSRFHSGYRRAKAVHVC